MKFISIGCFLVLIGMLTSCVSNKELIYFQYDEDDTDSTFSLKYPQDYRLHKGDLLYIDVTTQFPEANALLELMIPSGNRNQGNIGSGSNNNLNANLYFTGYIVRLNGYMRFPLIDSVYVLNKTMQQVEDLLTTELEEYFEDIFVTVKLPGMKVTLLGEFNAVGEQLFYQEQVTIMDVIARSGGFSQWADRKDIRLFRREQDQIREYRIDITDADLIRSELFYLQNGDVLYAEPLRRRQYGLGQSALSAYSTLISTALSTWAFITLIQDLTDNP